MSTLDYLVAGHVSRDLVSAKVAPEGYTTGGTAAFSSQVAQALGCKTAVLTSTAADIDLPSTLPGSVVVNVPAAQSTTFSNIYTPDGRQQIVHDLAAHVTIDHLPDAWRTIPIVHLGPITDRIDHHLVNAFDDSLIGITPQGWMRTWDADGRVSPIVMEVAEVLLPPADAVVIGEEDLVDTGELERLRQLCRLLVLTRSAQGCTLFQDGRVIDVPAPAVEELNATGAGDIFATAFFIKLHETDGDMIVAAEFANRIAALSVTQPNLTSKIDAIMQTRHTADDNGRHTASATQSYG